MKQKGFSLVELVIVVGIFVVITSIVIYNQNKFSSDISISNITYQIALELRQAQVYGTLVREGGPSEFDLAYGIDFFRNPVGDKIDFRLFADNSGDYFYQEGLDTQVNLFSLSEGNIISDICWFSGSDISPVGCFSEDDSEHLAVAFKRPDPDALISVESVELGGTLMRKVEITVTSAVGDKTKKIIVLNTGQISVK